MQAITGDPTSTRRATRHTLVLAAVFVAVTALSVLLLLFAPEPGVIAMTGAAELMLLVATVGCAFRQAQARAFWGGCAIWGWISLWAMYVIDDEKAIFFVLPLALVGGATARFFYLKRSSPRTRLIPWILFPSALLLAIVVGAMAFAGKPWLSAAMGLNLLCVLVGATGAAFTVGVARAFWGSCAICGSVMFLIGTAELEQMMHALVIPSSLAGGLVGRHFYLTRDSKRALRAGKLRFSLARLMLVVLSAAMACAALVGTSSVWTIALACLFIATLLISMVGVAFRSGAARAFWGGAAICLWAHFVILHVIGDVYVDAPHEIALGYLYESVLDDREEPDPVPLEVTFRTGTGLTYTLPRQAVSAMAPAQQRPRPELSYGAFELRGQMLWALILASFGAYLGRHLYATRQKLKAPRP